jgi:glutamate-1-semialdehyde aminotransferase/acyl carrier protein
MHELSGYPVEDLAEASTFLELGFDSLFLTQLSTAFHNEFQVKITFRQLFDSLPSIAAVSAHLDRELPAEKRVAGQETGAPAPAAAIAAPDRPAVTAAAAGSIAIPAMPAMPSLTFSGPVDGSRVALMQAVMAQQLQLMSQQIALLQGGRASVPAAVAIATPAAEGAAAAPVAAPTSAPREESAMPSGFGPNTTRRGASNLTPRQKSHLDALVARYTKKTARSKELAQRYRQWHADPRTAAGFNPLWKEMVYPLVVVKSSGSRLTDVDGNEYIDILNGFGPNFLGHSPPFVTEALKAQLDRGIEVGPQTPLAGETAQLFCEMTRMDRVSFVNTGSEAVQAAIRLARTFTSRDKIVVFRKDYHGNFDEVLVRGVTIKGEPRSVPLAPGIPRRAVEDVITLEYGAEESLDWIRAHGSELAAVLVEPVQSRRPELQPRDFLHELRRITQASGTVLVFDEVITGFRTGPGGAQAFYGVEADLATYGKVFGGGMPIGAVAGRSHFMDTFDGGMWQYGDDSFPGAGVTFFAGTFVRHPLAIAAANVVLKYLKSAGPALQEGVNRQTTRLTTALNALFQRHGIAIEVPHCCSQMFIRVNESSDLATLLFYHLRDRGVHVLEGFPTYMTASHTDADVDALIQRFTSSVEEMQDGEIFPRAAGAAEGVASDGAFPLTSSQRDVWLASQLGADASCAFNESDTLELRGTLDTAALQRALRTVLGRHQAFSLTFSEDGSEQRASEQPFIIELHDFRSEPAKKRAEKVSEILRRHALRPFDLRNGPLVRPLLFQLEDERHLLVIYSHHIVFDGWSADVLMRDVAEVYSAAREGRAAHLPVAVRFSDYAFDQNAFDQSVAGEADLKYWRESFAEPPSRLELPTDRPRTRTRTYNGSTVHATLDPALSEELKRVAKQIGLTHHSLLLSAFQVLLSRLSAQEDFVVGVPAAGQPAAGMGHLVGYCVSLMPLRTRCAGNMPFAAFARETRNAVLDAFEHQRADFARLTRELPIDRDPSRLPLAEVVFNYSGYLRKLSFAGLEATARENKRGAVLHDFFLNVVEDDRQMVIDWDYNTDLFDEETIRQWIQHFEVLLGAIAANPDTAVQELPLIAPPEHARLAHDATRVGAGGETTGRGRSR